MAKKQKAKPPTDTDEYAAIDAAARALDAELPPHVVEDTRDETDEIEAALRLLEAHGLDGDIDDSIHFHVTVEQHANPAHLKRTRNLALCAMIFSLAALLINAVNVVSALSWW